MRKDYDRFFKLIGNGFRLTKMHFKITKINGFHEEVNLEFKRKEEVVAFSSSEKDLLNYVHNLHTIPHIEDDDSDFMYIDDPDKYFEIEKKVTDIFSGELKDVVICNNVLNVDKVIYQLIKKYERMWIESERYIKIVGIKLAQIFFDVCIIKIKNNSIDYDIIDKNDFQIEYLNELVKVSQNYDVSVAISAFLLTERYPFKAGVRSDALIGIIEYDLKNQKVLAVNLNTISQLRRVLKSIGNYGLWECINEIFSRTEKMESFISLLPLPLNVKDYTCLPWICYSILGKLGFVSLEKIKEFNIPMLLVFRIPPIFLQRPGYIFKQEEQKALIMLGIRNVDSIDFHQIRFDISKGEPNLHVHYEIFSEFGVEKVVNHQVINYNDILNFNENLAIGLLIASAYDVTFDTYVIPKRFDGIINVFKDNPVMIYPLFGRSMAGEPCRTLLNNEELCLSFLESVESGIEKKINKTHKDALEKLGVIKEGKLTILGDIVNARLLQIRKM